MALNLRQTQRLLISLSGKHANNITASGVIKGYHVSHRWKSSHPQSIFEEFGLLQPGCFNFEVGAPNPAYLKTIADYLKTASIQLHSCNEVDHMLQYGCVAGTEPVRQEVANFLTRQYQQTVNWKDVFITSGATSGLEVLVQHFFTSNQVLFAENPTYPLFAKLFTKNKQISAVPIPMEADGLDIEYFERELSKLPDTEVTESRPFRAAVYLIPTYHNPTGCCYSPEKCQKLVELAREHELLIICDDVYNTLTYEEDANNPGNFLPSPQRLFAYDDKNDPNYKGHVVSNGSFAKIIAPGLRLGWYEAPKRVIDLLCATYLMESGGGQTAYVSNVVAEALKAGAIDKHVQSLRVAHKERMAAAIDVVETNLSRHGVTISHPSGGYFLWLKLPPEVDSAKVLEISKSQENVTFVKGNIASLSGDFSNYIRLSIAYYEADQIKEGVEKLCRSILAAMHKST